MMTSRISVWLCVIAVAGLTPLGLRAQSTSVASKQCLWKVEGGKTPVFLLGSVHFLREDAYPLAKPIEAAYARAKTVAFEVDLDEQNKPEVQAMMLKAGVCPTGKTLRDLVSEKTYGALTNHLAKRQMPVEMLQPLRPWLASVTLVVLELQRLGFSPEAGVDRHFHSRALKDGKRVAAFETIEFQMNLFASLSDEEGDTFMQQTVKEIGQFEKFFADIVTAWKSGNAAKLDELLLKEMKDYPALLKRFLTDRNKAWVPQLEKMLKGPDETLVVVGAGHLVGKDSVVDLLRQKGYKVTQQ